METTLKDALLGEIRDLYHAEKQLVRALPKLSKGATNPDLKEALTSHLQETEGHVSRLEEVFEKMGERARAKTCAGMAGIIEEGSELLDQDFHDEVKDAAIIAAAQRAEHYEMAAYGAAATWAKALGLSDVAALLVATLDEEKAADEKLSGLARSGINSAAAGGLDGESDDDSVDVVVPVEPKGRGNGRASGRANGRGR